MPARAAGTRATRGKAPARRGRARAPSVAETAAADEAPEAEAAAAGGDAPEPYTVLQKTLAQIFAQGQKTTAGHRKLVVNLRGVFDQCIAGTGSVGATIGARGRSGEKVFARDFCRLLNRVLVVKKSEVVGDRCLRLADLFVKSLVDGGGCPAPRGRAPC